MDTVGELQARIQEIVQAGGAALLPWHELAHWSGSFDAVPRALRVGELRFQHPRSAEWSLRAPATLPCSPPRHLLVSRSAAQGERATTLLNSFALRFALTASPERLRILLVDAYEDGRSALPALRRLRPPKVTFGRPNTITSWLAGKQDMVGLVVVYHALLEDEAPEDADHALRESDLCQLVEHLRDPRQEVMMAIAFDPGRPDHPLAVAAENLSLNVSRVTLSASGEDRIDGAEASPLLSKFTPDESPATDIAERILALAGCV